MATEIELKFIFNSEFEHDLLKLIDKCTFISTKTQFLHNVYFDTAARALRKMDMGLRVRSCDGSAVQTLKTTGKVVGGLHQRPEYNEPIDGLRPTLAAFPDEIWPENCQIEQLEEDLIPIFSTDFERQTWLVEMSDGTLIEVAYDKGFIEANQGKRPLCEIELELVKGDEKQLFELGKKVAQLNNVRLGNVSKAQHGYMLADGLSFSTKVLIAPVLKVEHTLEQALRFNLQHGLQHIQYHENCYLESSCDDALQEVLKGIKFLHQNINLFKSQVTGLSAAKWVEELQWLARSFSWVESKKINNNLLENSGFYLRKLNKYKLALKQLQSENEQLPTEAEVTTLFTSERYCQFILSLTLWLIRFEKKTFNKSSDTPLKYFAQQALNDVWQPLKQSFIQVKETELQIFLKKQGKLEAALFTGLSLAGLFDAEKSAAYRLPWIDIKQGIKELSMLEWVIDFTENELKDDQEDELKAEYQKWIKRKQHSLVHALQQSKQQALLKERYWLK